MQSKAKSIIKSSHGSGFHWLCLLPVMRALGVPSRVVTVFNAAHDTDGSLNIEEYYTSRGQKLSLSKDSVWLVLTVHLSHSLRYKHIEPFVMSPLRK